MNELRKAIELEHVSFFYEDSDEQVLRDAADQVKSFVRTGTTPSDTSMPLFCISPALIFMLVAPTIWSSVAFTIWSVVLDL